MKADDQLERKNRLLRHEIRVLHQRLRDSNRGAECNAKVAWALAKEGNEKDKTIKKLTEALRPACDRLEWVIQYLTKEPFEPWHTHEEWLPYAKEQLAEGRAVLDFCNLPLSAASPPPSLARERAGARRII